jgi:hypothetical protein
MTTENSGANEKVALYLVDDNGAVPAELGRYLEVSGYAQRLCQHSSDISNIISSVKEISYKLGSGGYDRDGRKVTFNFSSEDAAREELIRIAGFLKGINYKIWGVSRMIGTEAERLADTIQVQDDANFNAELDAFLKKEPVELISKP